MREFPPTSGVNLELSEEFQFSIEGLIESADRIMEGKSFSSIFLYDEMISALCSGQLKEDAVAANKLVRCMNYIHVKALENNLEEARICIENGQPAFVNWLRQAEENLVKIWEKDQIDDEAGKRISSEIERLYKLSDDVH